MKNIFVALAIAIFCAGCVSPSSKFYSVIRSEPPTNTKPEIYISTTPPEDFKQMLDEGYTLIGTSEFSDSSIPSNQELSSQAKKVGATAVVIYYFNLGTQTGTAFLSLPNPDQTVTSSSQGYVYSGGQSAFYNGQTTTTIPGGSSQYAIPYAVTTYEIHEGYFAKILSYKDFLKP